jgi:hypothetical protein
MFIYVILFAVILLFCIIRLKDCSFLPQKTDRGASIKPIIKKILEELVDGKSVERRA